MQYISITMHWYVSIVTHTNEMKILIQYSTTIDLLGSVSPSHPVA